MEFNIEFRTYNNDTLYCTLGVEAIKKEYINTDYCYYLLREELKKLEPFKSLGTENKEEIVEYLSNYFYYEVKKK